MNAISANDRVLMGLLQKQGAKSVSEISELMKVTETAVRQRLSRLTAQELISREEHKLSRGRPIHKYSLTKKGRRLSGQNFSDLATAIWEEVRLIEDVDVRSKVIGGIAKRLANKYRQEIDELDSSDNVGLDEKSFNDKAEGIARFFESRGIPVTIGANQSLPVLNLHGCPYPELSDEDDLICSMEHTMFSELAGCEIELHRCDKTKDATCCSFQLEKVAESN